MDREYNQKEVYLWVQEDLEEWLSGWYAELDIARAPYDQLRTSYWRRKAMSKLVELPSRTDGEGYWERSPVSGYWVLTDKGVASVRAAVRQETLASTEMIFRVGLIVVAAIGSLSGIGSIVIGLSSGC